ncbi:MAG TPA: phytoene/squalene synthase family protein [Polyangiaceae bacterium]
MNPRLNSAGLARAEASRIISNGSKSFALAGRILPSETRLDAQLIYAWCRHADDAIDNAPPASRAHELLLLRRQLDQLYGTAPLDRGLWEALRELIARRGIPQDHFATLLDGMQMDVDGTHYRSFEDLRLYCHRVAGVVGWLMVCVLGINDPHAFRPAAHLGIAMQLTNICRDVAEDWDNGRLYLPEESLARHGVLNLYTQLGQPFPRREFRKVAAVVTELLDISEHFYRVGDEGLSALPARSAFAVRTARLVYSAIGTRIRRAECDVLRGRAVVPLAKKLQFVIRSAAESLREMPNRVLHRRTLVSLDRIPVYPDDLLPW